MNRDLRASTEQDSSFVDGLKRRLERRGEREGRKETRLWSERQMVPGGQEKKNQSLWQKAFSGSEGVKAILVQWEPEVSWSGMSKGCGCRKQRGHSPRGRRQVRNAD